MYSADGLPKYMTIGNIENKLVSAGLAAVAQRDCANQCIPIVNLMFVN
jgi:hypothetical protein